MPDSAPEIEPNIAEAQEATETTPTPAPAKEQMPEAPAPAPQATSENFDFRAAYEAQAADWQRAQRQYQEGLAQSQAEIKAIRDVMQRAFDPQGYRSAREPRYVTHDDVAREIDARMQEANYEAEVTRQGEVLAEGLDQARTGHPRVFEVYGAQAEQMITNLWVNNRNMRSPADAARVLDEGLKRALDAEQKKWATTKSTAQTIKTVSAGAAGVATPTPITTARGINRLKAAAKRAAGIE